MPTTSVSAFSGRAHGGGPFVLLLNESITCLRVVPFLTCCNTRKCGELVDLLVNLMVPVAGRTEAPRNRLAVIAHTLAATFGVARVPTFGVTVILNGCGAGPFS